MEKMAVRPYLDPKEAVGRDTYQKNSLDAHRYETPSTRSAYHNLPTIGGVQQGVGPTFCATDLAYEANDRTAQLGMEFAKAYPPEARLKSWRRTVIVVEISDSYFLNKPVSDKAIPPTLIAYDASLRTPTVETISLDNPELKRN